MLAADAGIRKRRAAGQVGTQTGLLIQSSENWELVQILTPQMVVVSVVCTSVFREYTYI